MISFIFRGTKEEFMRDELGLPFPIITRLTYKAWEVNNLLKLQIAQNDNRVPEPTPKHYA